MPSKSAKQARTMAAAAHEMREQAQQLVEAVGIFRLEPQEHRQVAQGRLASAAIRYPSAA